MKVLGLALTAILTVSCSSPAAPTTASGASTALGGDEALNHTPGTAKVKIYFYAPELPSGGNVNLSGLNVWVWYDPAIKEQVTTGKQGSITVEVPKDATAVSYLIDPQAFSLEDWSGCVYRPEGSIPLPYSVRQNWVAVLTGCTPP
jgi:hypothetical protein